MSDVIKTVELPVFIKRKHELADLLKQVEKGSRDAVDLLIATMNSTDKTVELKMKVACATTLVDMQLKISSEISRDQLTRQIAEIKANGLKTPLGLEDGTTKRLPPTTDFNTIRSVE